MTFSFLNLSCFPISTAVCLCECTLSSDVTLFWFRNAFFVSGRTLRDVILINSRELVLMMYYDITEREKVQFDTGMCWGAECVECTEHSADRNLSSARSIGLTSWARKMVRRWCRQLTAGRQQVQDEERNGRPSIITDDLVELVRERIKEPLDG